MSGKSSLTRWVRSADILAGAFLIILVYLLANTSEDFAAAGQNGLTHLDVMFFVVYSVMALTGIAINGGYASGKRFSRLEDISAVLKNSAVSFVLLVTTAFILEDFILSDNIFSRPAILLFAFSFTFALIDIRLVAHAIQGHQFVTGRYRKKMVIIGAGAEGEKVYRHLQGKNWLGIKCLGFVDQRRVVSPVEEAPVLGRVEDLPRLTAERGVEEVIIALPPEEHDLMTKIVNNGIRRNVKVRLIPDALTYPYSKVDIKEYDGLALIDVKTPSLNASHRVIKRMMDIGIALALLAFDLPMFAVISLIIKLTSPGPVIYRQTRIGRDGKSFEMMKFRSMVADADQQRQTLERRNEAQGPIFKIRDDPRITPFGRLIRRTSLDELPQIFNVLKGEMSMVGPRPPLPEEVGRYKAHHLRRLAVRPGVTGLWQVSGRDRRDFEEMASLDLYYIENWSGWMDLKIILKTVPVVLSRRGAY